MSDYKKGIIYMIHHKDDLELYEPYIGSTFDYNKRMREHKSECYNYNSKYYNKKLYQHIRENGGWECYEVKIIEYYDCKGKRELEKREDEIMLNFHNRLNKIRACRSNKEWHQDNKDKLADYRKEWREANKGKMTEWHKKYYQDNKDKILERQKQYDQNNKDIKAERDKKYYEANKDKILEQKKQYQKDNKDKLLEYKKQYHQDNKDKIAEYKKQKAICDKCGSSVTINGIPRHKRTQKCINFICQKHT